MRLKKGTTPALEFVPPFGDFPATDVRRDAHRTTAETAALPKNSNRMVPI